MLLHAPSQRYRRLKIKNVQNDRSDNSSVNEKDNFSIPTNFIKKVQSALLAKGIKVGDMTVSRRLTYDFGSKLQKTPKKTTTN